MGRTDRSAAFEAADLGRTLVAAPHPDDESLGCGGAIALLRDAGVDVHILFISDGTRSHPNSRRYPAPALRDLREAEARGALAILGVPPAASTFLRLPDAAVPGPDESGGAGAVGAIRAVIEGFRPATILRPWRRDPHRDHRATWRLVEAAVDKIAPPPRCWEYAVWLDEAGAPEDHPRPGEVAARSLDIAAALGRKRSAIAAHRSQTTALIIDDPDGFRVPPAMLARSDRPVERYMEPIS